MSVFENVTVTREANIYFNGQVTSRTILFADGSSKTLGIMQPGDYTFTTGAAEIMEILSGRLEVLIAGAEAWKDINGGESFEVPTNSSFRVKVGTLTDYCCSFLK
ncbi:MAG: pyrimidine/purine nucleoside phosphorylase [Desulfoprunum sp.]|nr:pyrimidine/purine nucleoside phosphorylase [Desulfoprunum sp.]